MKPIRIFIVRHGQSEGNIDKTIYEKKPDYAVRLTAEGILQAKLAGEKIKSVIGNESVAVYYSPFFRTRDTTNAILPYLNYSEKWLKEEPRIREQEWCGKMREDGFMYEAEGERDTYGHFYYRFERGESCADVYDRVSDFFNTLHRDFEKKNFPDNCILVGHGMTNRIILMRWFHLKVEEFEMLANPKNGEVWQMEGTYELYRSAQKYKLVTPLRKYEKPRCQFRYPFDNLLPNKTVL